MSDTCEGAGRKTLGETWSVCAAGTSPDAEDPEMLTSAFVTRRPCTARWHLGQQRSPAKEPLERPGRSE